MKEATGEANMTIITVVLIGIVAGVAMIFLPQMMNTTQRRSCCVANGGTWDGGHCQGATDVCEDNTTNQG